VTDQKPAEKKTGFPPRIGLHVDGKERVVHVSVMRPIIDLQPIEFDLSFAAVKQMAAAILSGEANAEAAAAKARPKLVKS
jgi:hypothetical protein